ncbi:MAG: cupin domain-containing protein [Pseudomonadota bacterium]
MMVPIILLGAAAATIPSRTPLAVIPVAPVKPVSRVETTRVDFAPGQIMPRHKHNVPVICFVTKGNFLSNIGDAGEKPADVGDVTYEPPGVVVRYFQNASQTEAAQLLCASLAGENDTQLNVMLGDDQGK